MPLNLTTQQRTTAVQAIRRLRETLTQATSDAEVTHIETQIIAMQRRLRAAAWEPYPWQRPHVHPPGWVAVRAPHLQDGAIGVCDERCRELPTAVIGVHQAFLMRGGRGTGKTEGAAHYWDAHVNGPPCDHRVPGGHRLTIVAPTQADAVSSCVTGVSGLQSINPGITVATGKEGTIVTWPNGAVGRVLGAHGPQDVERARAWTNVCGWWMEEAAAQPHLEGMLDQAPFTLRLGDTPHLVITTTPKNRPAVAALIRGNPSLPAIRPATVQTWGRTVDATRLPAPIRASYEATYAGTSLGRQELDGELLADVEGALWVTDRPAEVDGEPNQDERPGIENDRVRISEVGWRSHNDEIPAPVAAQLVERVVVSVDPPGGRTEAGIVVVGSIGAHAYILADLSTAGPPDTWAQLAIAAYRDYGAEGIAAEHAYGGDMVDDVISTRDSAIPIFRVPTKVGKRLRAEPVQAISQQHRLHMVGVHPLLESEMTSWVAGEGESPNRLDAMVHGVTYLVIRARTATASAPGGQAVRPIRRATR